MNQGDETEPGGSAGGPGVCVIVNTGSGGTRDRAVLARVRAGLERHKGAFALRVVGKGRGLDAAIDEAIGEGFPVIAAAGGDGTVRAVAMKLAGTGRALGVLPLGTFNYFARGVGVPENLDDAIDFLATGAPVPVSVGEVNGRVFLNNASLGVYPAILRQREGIYRRWGRSRIAAHWSVILTFARFYRPLTLEIEVDGARRTVRSPLVFIARSAFQLQEFGLAGADRLADGRFAMFLTGDCGRWRLLLHAVRLFWRDMREGRDFEMISGGDITITPKSRTRHMAQDGERERIDAPFRFRVRSDALKVIAPPG